MPSQRQRIKGRFLKPVILRKDVHIVFSQQMEAPNATQWKADSLDELLLSDEKAMNTSSIAEEPSCEHLLYEALTVSTATLCNVSLLRGKRKMFSFRGPWYQ